MEPDKQLLEELKYLVAKRHKWYRNTLRTNLAHSKDDVVQKGTWRQLKVGIYSNGVRAGQNEVADRMLAIVQQMLPDANINSLQLNRNVQCAPHRDARNSSLQSFVLCFGEFEGGDLCLEDGRRFSKREVWHSFDGRGITHWNEPILANAEGVMMKYSIVAYSHHGTITRRRKPRHWLWTLLQGCKRRLGKWHDKLHWMPFSTGFLPPSRP